MMVIRRDIAIASGFIILLLFLYGFSLTRSLVSPPSEYMSREVPLIEAAYGFSRTVNSHTLYRVFPSGESALILCVDGNSLRTVEVDIHGKILHEQVFSIDLSQSSLIEISSLYESSLGVFYKTDALYHADLSLGDGSMTVRKLADDVLYFDSYDDVLVFGTKEGLYVLNPDSSKPLKIFSGKVLDFKLVCDENGCYTIIVHDVTFDTVRLELLHCSVQPDDCEKRMSVDVAAKYFSDIRDLRIDEGILRILYKYEDGRDRNNILTLQKIDPVEGNVISEEQCTVPLYHSNYSLIEGKGDDSRFIYQTDSVNGVNLALGILKENGDFSSHLITKTKSMSKLAGSFILGDNRALVFSDINYERRALLFSSDDSMMIEETTRFRTVPFWYPLFTTVLMYFVSLITGSLYLMALLPLPVLFLFITDHFIFNKMESPQLIQNSLIITVHSIVKLFLTHIFISSTFNYSFQPVLIGNPGVLLTILVLASLVSAILSMRKRGIDFYISFALYDYLFYTGLVSMYLTTSILLGKV